MKITDYGNSYVTWTGYVVKDDTRVPGHMPWPNTVRILLDSRCWITDDSGDVREYNMLSPCRTEWMYRPDVLWQEPNYEFAGIYSDTEWMAGHIRAGDVNEFGGDWRVAQPIEGRFKELKTVVRHYPKVEKLENDRQVVEATQDYLPIIARTDVWSDDGKTRATVEYPIKTMNVQIERGRMQVDTGPLIFPRFPGRRRVRNTQAPFRVCLLQHRRRGRVRPAPPNPRDQRWPRRGYLHRLLRHQARTHPKHLLTRQ